MMGTQGIYHLEKLDGTNLFPMKWKDKTPRPVAGRKEKHLRQASEKRPQGLRLPCPLLAWDIQTVS